MPSSWKQQAARRMAVCMAAGLGLAAAPSFGAVTVTNTGVKAGAGSGIVIYYTLNEPATSVQIALSNGTNLTGGTAKGQNEVSYTGAVSGVSATITATAAAENGAGGANVILAPVKPAGADNITGVTFFGRPGSPYLGQFLVVSGFNGAGVPKKVYRIGGDGTTLKTGDLTVEPNYGTKASYPFGLAVGQQDPQDRIWVPNRSGSRVALFNPSDLSYIFDLATYTTYVGTSVTPIHDANGAAVQNQFNLFVGGNNSAADQGGVYRYTTDLGASPPTISARTLVADTTAASTNQSIAVDPGNKVMFQTHLSALEAAGTESKALTRWSSSDDGATWSKDVDWSTAVTTSIGTAGTPYAVAFDKGFDANNLANSYVWVAMAGAGVNKIVKLNAGTGALVPDATIDLTQLTVPDGAASIGDKPLRFLSVDYAGNLGLALGAGTNFGTVSASHYAIVAPNTSGATTTSSTLSSIEPPLSATGSVDVPSVGNTGNATVNYAIQVFDSAGIVADNVQVTGNLSAIGGGASVALTRGTVSADGKSATYTTSYKVPANATLGASNLPFTVTAASGSTTVRVAQSVYNALVPAWTKSVSGKVTGVAANGGATYVATDAGNVYSFGADGAPSPNFGNGSGVSVGEPVTRPITAGNGRLYVPGSNHLFILDIGTGVQTGSFAVTTPSAVALHPTDASVVYVGGGDNKVHALDANTGAQKYASADLGGAVNTPGVGGSFATTSQLLLTAGTEAGAIVMLNPDDLTQAFTPLTDTKGAVRSKPAFGLLADGFTNYFVIGGASGLWGVNAETGTKFEWPTDGTHSGNPYATPNPVDADPAIATFPSASAGNSNRIMFAGTGGNFYIILAGDGGKLSFGGVPADLTPAAGGFTAGAGVLVRGGKAVSDNSTDTRIAWLGSDPDDGRFFAANTLPDDSSYGISAQTLRVFDPKDTATYPGEVPGGFVDKPVAAGTNVVVGSTAGRVYAFPDIVKPNPYVTDVSPANGARGVSPNQAVSVTFSQPINYGLAPEVRLLQNGADVAGSYELSVDGQTISFTPSAALTSQAAYAFVAKGFTNTDGTALAAPFSSSFYVGTPPAVQGDVNGDTVFNLQDVAEALRIAGGLKGGSNAAVTATGNKVTPGSITVEDAVFLARVKAGLASF